ncbi:MAG: hypothetical protein IPG93_08890 [Burkholderiales bacterium]|nr:hypothetical protein [Burkholderiales bacterium]
MNRRLARSFHRVSTPAAALVAGLLLAACGGGSDPASPAPGGGGGGGGGGAVTLTCNTALFAAGAAVAVPTSAQLTSYAGTWVGDEGTQGGLPTDPFVRTGAATAVLGADGVLSYQGTAQTVSSACVETFAGGAQLVLHLAGGAGLGHLDLNLGTSLATSSMTGISPASTLAAFVLVQNGHKQ